ncbi:MAG TPA: SCP2 sterol-binding domain-containing protein [Candidatus Binatia bacterium]|nr:SCP2 sterol-binding domain-containing protein [Candidatus Binatia bacterium]
MPTVTELFDEINTRLADPAKAGTSVASYRFDLSGEDGGEYHILLEGGKGEAGAGAPENPNTTISMAASDFVALSTGQLDPTMAFMTGKIKVRGDMGLAMKLQTLLR